MLKIMLAYNNGSYHSHHVDVIFKLAFYKVTHYINYLQSYVTMAFMNG